MQENKPLIAILLGVLATIPNEIFTRILLFMGIGKYSVYQLTSLIVTLNRPTAIMGIVTSSIIGGAAALACYYLLPKVSYKYMVIKGLLTGLISWIGTELLFTWLIEGPKIISARPVSDYYLQMFGSIIFGFTLGILFKRYLIPKDAHI